jgi:WD40-like Beta Propeller Repeat
VGSRAIVLGVVAAALGVWAVPAWGASGTRNGDLVVATGKGLELVNAATGAARPICTDVTLCGHPVQPSFSPNGRAIVFIDRASHRPVVIAADGSCLWCRLGPPLTKLTGSAPAFMAGGRTVTLAGNELWSVSLTGGRARRLVTGRVQDAVWSSRGRVALVRGGWIWVGRPGHGRLRPLARGKSPSFSPGGARLTFARGGQVWIVGIGGRGERRLVGGSDPAWSPNGQQIAYLGLGGAVEAIGVRGGRPHRVGAVRAAALAWRPLPASGRKVCTPPQGSKVLASSRGAVVYSLGGNVLYGPAVYGCLKALDRTQPLSTGAPYFHALVAVRLAGRFAALEPEYSKGGILDDATVYDLSSGARTQLAQVGSIYGGASTDEIDSLTLDSSGFAAWRETTTPFPTPLDAVSCPSASLCVAGGGGILSSTNPTGGSNAWNVAAVPSSQSDLAISGVACPSISLCAAVDANDVLTSTEPVGGASAWTNAPIAGYPNLSAISCPSVSLCVATGGGPTTATIATSTDPVGGAGSWSTAQIPAGSGAFAVSCPSVSMCIATTHAGNILTSSDPTGGLSGWTQTAIDTGTYDVEAVSCPSVSLCVAGDSAGHALISTAPAAGASSWTNISVDPGNVVFAVSCPTVSLCVAGDSAGNVITSTDPTGGASAWTKTSVDQGVFVRAVACPSVALCVAVDQNGKILTSTDPTGGAHAWTSATVDLACVSHSTPCISEQLYARDDQGSRVVDTAPPGAGSSIGNIKLGGDSLVLSWTNDGAPRQLQLR